MSKDFDIKVLVKDELKKNLIFGLEARPPIGIILGLAGYNNQVIPLLQKISHGTRAFVVNADGLSGFVLPYDILKHLKEADENGQLEHARQWQIIDISKVERKLGNF